MSHEELFGGHHFAFVYERFVYVYKQLIVPSIEVGRSYQLTNITATGGPKIARGVIPRYGRPEQSTNVASVCVSTTIRVQGTRSAVSSPDVFAHFSFGFGVDPTARVIGSLVVNVGNAFVRGCRGDAMIKQDIEGDLFKALGKVPYMMTNQVFVGCTGLCYQVVCRVESTVGHDHLQIPNGDVM